MARARYVFYTTLSRPDLTEAIRRLPSLFAGKVRDPTGVVRQFKLRLAFAWLSLVKEAFIVKARGGTDEAGISWPKLTPEYLAYGRGPFSTRRAGRSAPGIVVGGPRDGQQKDGFLTKKQLADWRRDYARALRWLNATDAPDASCAAAAIAWSAAKKRGVKTKLGVFGSREVDILRDRGILFNSLQPGMLSVSGSTASYTPPENQVVEEGPGWLAVGTNVAYAIFHQLGSRLKGAGPMHRVGCKKSRGEGRGAIRRQIWPEADQVPSSWHAELSTQAAEALPQVAKLVAEGKL